MIFSSNSSCNVGALSEVTTKKNCGVERVSDGRFFGGVVFCSFVAALNTVATMQPLLGLIVGLISYVIVLGSLLFKGPWSAFLWVLLFASCSFESEAYVAGMDSDVKLYGFARMPVIGFVGVLALVLLCYIALTWKRKPSLETLERHPILKNVNRCLNVMLVSGVIMFALAYLTNDNTVASQGWYMRTAVGEAARDAFCILVLKFVIVSVLIDRKYIERLVLDMTSILVALSLTGLIVSLLGWHGVYYSDKTHTVLSPLSHIFASSLLLIGFFQKGARRKVSMICGGISLVALMVLFPSPLSGTWAVMQVLLLVVLLLMLTSVKRLSVIVLTAALVVSAAPPVLDNLEVDGLVQYKFSQATNLAASFLTGEDVSDSAHSANTRVDEFVNAAWELLEKPQYLLFGKGFGGSTAHHTDVAWTDEGDFSTEQVNSGVFVRLHTTPSLILLKHGLVGLGLFVLLFVACVSGIRKSPWAFLGIYWLTFYFASFPTLALLGCSALVIGVYGIEKASNMKEAASYA